MQMQQRVMTAAVTARHAAGRAMARLSGERGEGVISAAIAVLIIAFLGAAMWLFFDNLWNDTSTNISDQVNDIGTSGG